MDLLGDEWCERRHQPGQYLEAFVQGGERRYVTVPEPATRSPDIPVRQVVDETREAAPRTCGVEILQGCVDFEHRGVQLGDRPAIQQRPLRHIRHGCGAGHPLTRVGVQHEESRRVPVGQQHLAHDIFEDFVADPARRPWRTTGEHVPAQRIGAVFVHERNGLEDVAEMLAHLAAVFRKDVTKTQHCAVTGLVEDERADRHQCVEPATGLIDRLGNEVGRIRIRKLLAGHMRIPELRERHRARVVPPVDDFGHPRLRLAALGTGESDLVDVRPMRIETGKIETGEGTKLRARRDAGEVAVFAAPQRERRSPVPITRQCPVDVVA